MIGAVRVGATVLLLARVAGARAQTQVRDTVEQPNALTDAERTAGWRLLFDGHTFNGWRGLGLDSVPGGGAEILVDRVRKLLHCYSKASSDEWLDVMRYAHRAGLRTAARSGFPKA